MGREANCKCEWGGAIAEVKALLETNELILRGGIRKRVGFSDIQTVQVLSDRLCFQVGIEAVQLYLGSPAAAKWAAAITCPPPTLSRKLGITNKTVVRVIGHVQDSALESALAVAARVSDRDADLIVAYVDSPESLHQSFEVAKEQIMKGVAAWTVYAKGPNHLINESMIRSVMREYGMMDTKVASVSAKLTALRFNFQKLI